MPDGGARSGTRIAWSVHRTARKLTPLIRKQAPVPSVPMISPASDGPTTLVTFCVMELSATAFGRPSGGTSAGISEWRAGRLKDTTTPRAVATAITSAIDTVSDSTIAARTKASAIAQLWVTIISRRRSNRSAMAPPTSVNRSMGRPRHRLTSARSNGEPVVEITSQLRATWSIQSPMWDTSVPVHIRR